MGRGGKENREEGRKGKTKRGLEAREGGGGRGGVILRVVCTFANTVSILALDEGSFARFNKKCKHNDTPEKKNFRPNEIIIEYLY